MVQTVKSAYQPMNIFTEFNIGSFGSENEMFSYDQDYAAEILSRFTIPLEIHRERNPIYENEKIIQEAIK